MSSSQEPIQSSQRPSYDFLKAPYAPPATSISRKSSIYSVSTSHEARVPNECSQKHSLLPALKLDTNICAPYTPDHELLHSRTSRLRSPPPGCSYKWGKEIISHRGIICDIDRYGNSVYRDPSLGEVKYKSFNPSTSTKQDFTSSKHSSQTSTATNTSASASYKSGYIKNPPLPASEPTPTMLEIHSQFMRSLPDDDALSTITSLTTRQLEEDIMTCLHKDEFESPHPLRINSTSQTRCDGENGSASNSADSSNRERGSVNNSSMVESWRSEISPSSRMRAQTHSSVENPPDSPGFRSSSVSRQISSDESVGNFGGSLIGNLEPAQETGLKRLGGSRRRYDRRESGSAGAASLRYERDEQEIKNLKAEVEAARSKTLSFQTILQRTSQRFVDAQNQNEELQRQISDLRDHQKLLYNTLASSNIHKADSPYAPNSTGAFDTSEGLEGVTGMLYKDNISEIAEENTRLKTQVKSLARELAGREEEVRLLLEEMGKQKDIYKAAGASNTPNERNSERRGGALTDKSASRMAARMKWWRRFFLG
ncbi:hypothetical protein TWF481_002086 [Arthrobotrys musiformis]|uniref:Uncharacterized protein n=1 Tax=Arthrobotrys musiformis TaxID=47236 RepID=A0AAV9VS53_9PEZI